MKKRTINRTNKAGDHLYRQVEEQSDYCDVLLKVGIWERRYHWCVLTASPFFEAVYRQNLTERNTGVIKICIGSSLAVETVLRYMYDQELEISEKNVVSILEVADFLFLENVKEECIAFLQSLDVIKNTCFQIHRASVLFNFDIPKLDTYWDKNFLNIISGPEVLNIQKEPLKEILLDESNRCISKELFYLIVRWVTEHSTSDQKQHFTELFLCLDISLIDPDFLEHTVKQNNFVQTNKDCQEKVASYQWRGEENVNVIVTKESGKFYCLCPEDGSISFLGSVPDSRIWTCNHDAMTPLLALLSNRNSLVRFDITSRTSTTLTVPSGVRFEMLMFANESLYGIAFKHFPKNYTNKHTLYQLVDKDDGTSVEAIPIFSFKERVESARGGHHHVLCFQTPTNVITYNTITCISVVQSIPILAKDNNGRVLGALTPTETGGCIIPVQQSFRRHRLNVLNGRADHNRLKWMEISGNPTETEQAATVRIRSVPFPLKGRLLSLYYKHQLLISAYLVMVITRKQLQLFSRKTSHECSAFDSSCLDIHVTSTASDAVFTSVQRKHLACCLKCPHKAQQENTMTSVLSQINQIALLLFLTTSALQANDQYVSYYDSDHYYDDGYAYYNGSDSSYDSD